MIHWFNYTEGRRFSFISSTLESDLIDTLVRDGFYYMGDHDYVRCCGCRNRVNITRDTKKDHKNDVPDCYLITTYIVINSKPVEIKIGISTAEDELKIVLRRHRALHQASYRQRTFDAGTDEIYSNNGFVKMGESLECVFCHYITDDWNADTIKQRHEFNTPNCIFIVNKLY